MLEKIQSVFQDQPIPYLEAKSMEVFPTGATLAEPRDGVSPLVENFLCCAVRPYEDPS